MFSRKKNKDQTPAIPQESTKPTPKKSGGIPSIISSDLHIIGNVVNGGTVDIDGIIEGNVKCQTATVRKHGHIKGDVIAESVHVYGKIQGLIKARSVHFFKGCRAEGVIMHESITIEDGAFVDGRFKRTENLDLDENEGASTPIDTAPAETKKLFGTEAESSFDDSQFKSPSFASDESDSETKTDENVKTEESEQPTGKKGKKKKQESAMDNLRLISDVS